MRRLVDERLPALSGHIKFSLHVRERFQQDEDSPSYPGVRTIYRKTIYEVTVDGVDSALLKTLGLADGEVGGFEHKDHKGYTRAYSWLTAKECLAANVRLKAPRGVCRGAFARTRVIYALRGVCGAQVGRLMSDSGGRASRRHARRMFEMAGSIASLSVQITAESMYSDPPEEQLQQQHQQQSLYIMFVGKLWYVVEGRLDLKCRMKGVSKKLAAPMRANSEDEACLHTFAWSGRVTNIWLVCVADPQHSGAIERRVRTGGNA